PFSSSQAPTVQGPVPPPGAPPQQPDPPHQQIWSPPPASPYGVTRGARQGARRAARPQALVSACLLTWACAAMAVFALVGSITILFADSRPLLDRMHQQNPQLADQGVSDHTIVIVALVMCAAFLAWTLAAAAFALLLFLGQRWAWYALVVSAIGAAVICLVGVIGSLVMLLPLGATLGTIALLVRPEVRAWLRGSSSAA
ncbi:MAG: hypothetical protein J2P22_10475, partial [Nocardioides sp.]|nr:hypothetical protein [Nocardioides sp.]